MYPWMSVLWWILCCVWYLSMPYVLCYQVILKGLPYKCFEQFWTLVVHIHYGNGWCVFQISHWKVWELQTDKHRKALTAPPAEGSDTSVPKQMLHNPCNSLVNRALSSRIAGELSCSELWHVPAVFVECLCTLSTPICACPPSSSSSKAGERALTPLLYPMFDLWWKQAQVCQETDFHGSNVGVRELWSGTLPALRQN